MTVARALAAGALLLLGCGSTDAAKDEGKSCSTRSDCVEVCATVCSGLDAGAQFHCTSFSRAVNECLCGFTVDGGVRPVGC